MNGQPQGSVLPYSAVVGLNQLKTALELTYVAPTLGGVLISGDRGTGKSTVVRAFCAMTEGKLPVTIPINATEDRVVGGWNIEKLMEGKPQTRPGLLEEADGRVLYIDEVNLLDDHIVNIILDVTATGILEIQREGRTDRRRLRFSLVGTMNPEEGGLRPQLLDRFGLMVRVETDPGCRAGILKNVLAFEDAIATGRDKPPHPFLEEMRNKDLKKREQLERARSHSANISESLLDQIANAATVLELEGYRGERIWVQAARALASIENLEEVKLDHVKRVAPMALQHRRGQIGEQMDPLWGEAEDRVLNDLFQ